MKRRYKLALTGDKRVKIDAYAAARLPIRSMWIKRQLAFPSRAQAQLNFKVLLNFHTEYILDQGGHFLNEVDPNQISENGIVNGAGFNYGLARDGPIRTWILTPSKLGTQPFASRSFIVKVFAI